MAWARISNNFYEWLLTHRCQSELLNFRSGVWFLVHESLGYFDWRFYVFRLQRMVMDFYYWNIFVSSRNVATRVCCRKISSRSSTIPLKRLCGDKMPFGKMSRGEKVLASKVAYDRSSPVMDFIRAFVLSSFWALLQCFCFSISFALEIKGNSTLVFSHSSLLKEVFSSNFWVSPFQISMTDLFFISFFSRNPFYFWQQFFDTSATIKNKTFRFWWIEFEKKIASSSPFVHPIEGK